jgi:hypothetical protein
VGVGRVVGSTRRFGSPPGPRSTLDDMSPDFLNSREDAILVWTVLVAGLLVGDAFYKDFRGSWSVVRAFFVPKLLVVFGAAALYAAGLVLLAERVGFWHTTALKETCGLTEEKRPLLGASRRVWSGFGRIRQAAPRWSEDARAG